MNNEDKLILKTKAIIKILKKQIPNAKTELVFNNPLQLLVATILSAQCTDVRVNAITPFLFSKYKNVEDFAKADIFELEQDIKSTGFYKMKAKHIKEACIKIVEEYGGKVPDTMDKLLTLSGVGRKTANCVLGGAFGIQCGIVVDTHVLRLSNRIGLAKKLNPEKLEQELMHLVPQKYWYEFSNLLVLHGRRVCNARKPKCGECAISNYCDYFLSK